MQPHLVRVHHAKPDLTRQTVGPVRRVDIDHAFAVFVAMGRCIELLSIGRKHPMTIKMLTRLSTYDLNQPALMCIDNIELPAGSAREKGHLIRGRARAARMAPFGYLKAVHHPSLH